MLSIHCRFSDKEVQRDAKLVSYDIVDKDSKPYVQVDVAGSNKVRRVCMHALIFRHFVVPPRFFVS